MKAAFTAAFPMEAAMPYLLEEAIYECYKDYGWNTDGWEYTEDANIYFEQPWESNGACWPIMDDLLKNMDRVVKSKNFDSRLESDYTASLVARFKNLTVGAKGQMLNCRLSTDLVELLDKKVIFELDDLKSPEDKCLMMGLIIVRLSEAIKMRFMRDPEFKHISLIEEAHRLLEKPSPGDDGSRKHAVGMFTDLLAEVRKYGESLVIVDQIPNKLAPEVLKNTNMKIIHKLFAKDDRSAIGDTVGLDDEQKDFLTDLRIGEVVIYSGEWSKAVHAKIREAKLTQEYTEAELAEHVKSKGAEQLLLQQRRYFPEIAANNVELSQDVINDYKRIKKRFWKILDNAVEKALRETSGEASNRKFSISFSTLKAMAVHLKPMKVICSSSDEILALLISDIKLRLPLDTDKELLEEYTLGLQALFNEIRVEKNNSLESFINDDLYQELFSKVY
ncbi:MAG: ATP-binding protein [Moritella sp.]|nr:ATP-binding protein [Moritella sp.]